MFNDYLPNIIEALKKLDSDNDGKIDIKDIGEALASIAKTFLKEQKK